MRINQFIEKLEQAWQEAKLSGLTVNKAVLFAQAALETGWGTSSGCIKGNNLFGIKATKTWHGRVINLRGFEEKNGKNEYGPMDWRAYDDWADCVVDYSSLMNRLPWFKDAVIYSEDKPDRCDADLFLKNIIAEPPSAMFTHGEPGWATDSKYFDKVKKIGLIIQRNGGPSWT
jgi:flagellum-specific peptidoglycan hydrolase FlgJ